MINREYEMVNAEAPSLKELLPEAIWERVKKVTAEFRGLVDDCKEMTEAGDADALKAMENYWLRTTLLITYAKELTGLSLLIAKHKTEESTAP